MIKKYTQRQAQSTRRRALTEGRACVRHVCACLPEEVVAPNLALVQHGEDEDAIGEDHGQQHSLVWRAAATDGSQPRKEETQQERIIKNNHTRHVQCLTGGGVEHEEGQG